MGVAGIAVPLWMKNGKTVAGSLAISGPMQRIDERAAPHLLNAFHEARRTIERVLGLIH